MLPTTSEACTETALTGVVSSLVYYNEENGYTVMEVTRQEDGEVVTVVGSMPVIAPGESCDFTGQWTVHSTYGPQFQAETVSHSLPTKPSDILLYLSSGILKGVGAATARRIVSAFGSETMDILARAPEKLTQIRGISARRAQEIGETFSRVLSTGLLMDFLTAHELPLALGMALYRHYGPDALAQVQENPYCLLWEESVPLRFAQADQLALSLGQTPQSPARTQAALLYQLRQASQEGHVFLPRPLLLEQAAALLCAAESALSVELDALLQTEEIIFEEIGDTPACYLRRLHRCERQVAAVLCDMAAQSFPVPETLEDFLTRIEQEQGIAYAPLQREAICAAAREQVLLLTGGPGTGKTTSLRGVLRLFDYLGLRTALAAPTGRAAKRLSESCGQEAFTIHRLLEPRYDSQRGCVRFSHRAENPLPVDALIVDETSMVDLPLMDALLDALPRDCRLILVGDSHQLPSVGPGNLLGDLLESQALPTLRLTEIFRQAAQSAIIRGAYAVDTGSCPSLKNRKQEDCFFLSRDEPQQVADTIVELCRHRLPQNMGIPPEQIQVLSPTRKGPAGTLALNAALQDALNPPQADKAELSLGTQVFREGDRVMQIKNNYDLFWSCADGTGGVGVFNGDIGRILSVDARGGTLVVDFDGRLAEYTRELLVQLEPAWAITVHKSQGSEYPAVILAASQAPYPLLNREVLYTAITRAKNLLILVGRASVLSQMAQNNRPRHRFSGLLSRLHAGAPLQ